MLRIAKPLTIITMIIACAFTSISHSQEIKSPSKSFEKAKTEFYQEKAKNPVYRRELYDINYNIRYSKDFAENRRILSVDEAWQGVMEKAWNPVKYIPHAIIHGVVLKETIQEDANTANFVRVSLQRPFQKVKKGKYTVVREEVSIDKINKIVYFMGRPAHPSDYKLLKVDPKDVAPQVTFLDEHKIVVVDNEPVDVWTLVTLPTKGFQNADQLKFVEDLGLASRKPASVYQNTQKLFSDK